MKNTQIAIIALWLFGGPRGKTCNYKFVVWNYVSMLYMSTFKLEETLKMSRYSLLNFLPMISLCRADK